ncbi:MAG: TonB-dependent receptor, partial [Caulobacterales bacterium]|nr:TonB-dependent receptor [Caulobacterales bacterium]
QLGFKGSRGQFVDLDQDGIAETIVLRQTLPSTDPAAQALGAEPLTPEKSENFSAGFTFAPGYGFTLTVDAYRIDVEDRIALSTQFNRGDTRASASGGTIGDEISALLDAAGFDESLGGANYFTNAIDTRSEGVDVVGTWQGDVGPGMLRLNAAYNYNDDSVESIDPNPEELSGLILADGTPIVQFDRARLGTYTDEIPASKFSLAGLYELGSASVSLRATRFGEFTNVATSEANDTFNDAEWIVDAEIGYRFASGLGVYGGANNVFNTYPDEVRAPNSLGTNFYDTISPYGFTGGNWYLRLDYDF